MSVRLINPPPPFCHSASPPLLHTHLSFSVLAFGLGRRCSKTNESIPILSYELLNIHLPIVSSRVIHAIGSLSNKTRRAVS